MCTIETRSSRVAFCFLLAVCLVAGGCASGKKTAVAPTSGTVQSSEEAAPASPDAKINISYSRPGDFLNSLTVTEYSSADTVLTEPGKGPVATIVRFEGGIAIWQIGVRKRLLSDVPMLGEHKLYAVKEVLYGKLPANFDSTIPDSGPPQPLQSDHYYVFTVTRASGITSYEAVKVNSDGSLEAYAAEPRAGDSFRLCCDLAADFVVSGNAMSAPGYP
jgi:hypothetical protein